MFQEERNAYRQTVYVSRRKKCIQTSRLCFKKKEMHTDKPSMFKKKEMPQDWLDGQQISTRNMRKNSVA
jgi:hypothetical protein